MTQKERELLELVVSKTQQRAITWEPTAAQDEFVTAVQGQASITVGKNGGSFGTDFYLTVRDQQGRDLFSHGSSGVVSASDVELVERLYEAAHHSALKFDETLNSILEDLKKAG